jgi:Domain of unknown function (DUF1830)
MTTIFFPPPAEEMTSELCCFINHSEKVVIVRIRNIAHWYCERVVFPQERFMFSAPPNAELEVHRNTQIGMTYDAIPCEKLRVSEGN